MQELRGKMGMHLQRDSLRHLFGACSRLKEVQQKVNEYGSLRQRVGELAEENVSMKRSLDMCNQEIRRLKTKEKGQKKNISQIEQQLAELHKEKEKTQLLEKRVQAMEGRFQAMGNALCLSDGEGHSEIQEVKKRKVEDKVIIGPYFFFTSSLSSNNSLLENFI